MIIFPDIEIQNGQSINRIRGKDNEPEVYKIHPLEAAKTFVDHTVLETFQIPEVVPNTTLDETEEVIGSSATLVRKNSSLSAVIATQDLPAGIYTFWWHLSHSDGEVSNQRT